MTFNARLGTAEGAKSIMCQDMLESILSVHVSHDAQLDPKGMLGYRHHHPYFHVIRFILL